MRVSNSMLYDSIVSHLQQSSSRLQELYEQASSQKRVNKPSDDPVGMARILDSRDAIKAFERYRANVDTAKGWLGTADKTLMEVQDILARLKELGVQAANATMSADDRKAIALEVRQNLKQLVSLSNTQYEGKQLFSGHKVQSNAYIDGLSVFSNNLDSAPYVKSVAGSSDQTLQVRFEPISGNDTGVIGSEGFYYRYSSDGGSSWTQKALPASPSSPDNILDLDGVQITLRDNYEIVSDASAALPLVGDPTGGAVTASASGDFSGKTIVRIDQDVDMNSQTELSYSLSTDGGKTFESGYSAAIAPSAAGDPEATLMLGNGRSLTITDSDGVNVGTNEIDSGEEFVIRPATELQVAPTALYHGDDTNSSAAEIEPHSISGNSNFGVSVLPQEGSFDGDVTVQIDDDPVTSGIEYKYSLDDGESWSDHLIMEDNGFPYTLELPGGRIRLENAGAGNLIDLQFTVHGTPVRQMKVATGDVHAHAMGGFSGKTLVRIDDADPSSAGLQSIDMGSGGTIRFSYSLDGGDTWVEGNTAANPNATGEYAELILPDGLLKLAPTDNVVELTPGDQFLIHPRTAAVDTQMSQGMQLAMNVPGVEVFGGHYQNEAGMEAAFEEDERKNLFVGLGKLIAGLETNDQEQIQQSLASIDGSIDQVSRAQSDIGARENRLEVSEKVLADLELNEKERKSRIEDVDFAELMSRLSQQQTVYQAIMKTSAMIMSSSLMDYL